MEIYIFSIEIKNICNTFLFLALELNREIVFAWQGEGVPRSFCININRKGILEKKTYAFCCCTSGLLQAKKFIKYRKA